MEYCSKERKLGFGIGIISEELVGVEGLSGCDIYKAGASAALAEDQEQCHD